MKRVMIRLRTGQPLADLALDLLPPLFLAILFLQSGLDKVIDRKGNLEWLTGHFAKSPLRAMVGPLFAVLTVLELGAGVLSGLGVLQIIFAREHTLALWGAVASGVSLASLFFGQRMAKDYGGAASLVPYFILTLVAIYLLR